MREISTILAAGWDSAIILRFFYKGLEEGAGQATTGVGNKSTLMESGIFSKSGDAEGGGIILGDNPARHGFVLTDLVPLNILKQVMIVKLKIRT